MTRQPPMRTERRRRWALAALVALVVAAHLLLTDRVRSGLLDMQPSEASTLERMDAELLDDMGQSAPVAMVAPAPAPEPSPPDAAPAPEPVASAPRKRAEVAPPPPPEADAQTASASAPDLAAAPPASTPAAASTTVATQAPTPASGLAAERAPKASARPFEWPLATRITFKLEGHFRGPLSGTAMVEWVRQGENYQVHVDASAGLLASQRSTSQGVITPWGLEPRRYESVNRLFIRTGKPRVTVFEGDEVVLSTGERQPRLQGLQDPASHFIQLAYDLLLGRQTLVVGKTVELPMALAKKQQALVYDVVAEEALQTPLGDMDTFKLVPRRNPDQKDDVLAEIWVAPSLQFLPVRMLIRQGSDNYMDLQMDKAPQQRMDDERSAKPAPSAPSDTRRTRSLDPTLIGR